MTTYNVKILTAVVDGHLPPLARISLIRKQLRHELLRRKPPLPEATLLSVLAEDDILPIDHARRRHRHGLLARAHHIKAQAALPLRVEHDDVEDRDVQHVGVELDNDLIGDIRFEGAVDDIAVLVDDAVRRQGGP